MKLKINISPCPNDTFIFDAMLNGRIDTEGFGFESHFADIEELNDRALGGDVDICKVSYAILPQIADRYNVLTSGGALGYGNGPLFVSRGDVNLSDDRLKIAVPGEHTTANLLMNRLYPQLKNKRAVLFSEVADRVADGEFDAGVLIHEGRFTFAKKGLHLIVDLGVKWDNKTSLPLPLGAIAVSRRIDIGIQHKINQLIRKSIWHAYQYPEESRDFILSHAREMDKKVIADHIALFVNDYSVNLGLEGRRAVHALTGIVDETIFVE